MTSCLWIFSNIAFVCVIMYMFLFPHSNTLYKPFYTFFTINISWRCFHTSTYRVISFFFTICYHNFNYWNSFRIFMMYCSVKPCWNHSIPNTVCVCMCVCESYNLSIQYNHRCRLSGSKIHIFFLICEVMLCY